jgi:hypothetical protein
MLVGAGGVDGQGWLGSCAKRLLLDDVFPIS